MSGAFDPWAALAAIRRARLGRLGADEVPAAAGEARFSASLGGLGALGAERHAASDSEPAPVTEGRPMPPGKPEAADADAAELAARLMHLAAAGAVALAEPDPGLDEERRVIGATRAAEAAGELPVKPEADHRTHLAALLRSALMRPPSWEGGAPPPGAFCSCCSRHKPEAGGRWWQPRQPRMDGLAVARGWRCWACHPPPPGCETEEVRT